MLYFKEMTITPQMAESMLQKNEVNRLLNIKRARQYAQDMASGKWQFNGEAIKFYEDGMLADGQHRLKAIIIAKTPIKTLVIYGMPRNVTIQDRGRTRTISDSMILEGADRSLASSTIVGLTKLHYNIQKPGLNRNISDGIVKDFIYRNANTLKEILSSSPKGSGRKDQVIRVRNAPILLASFYAYNCGAVDISTIQDFLDVLYTGIQKELGQTAAIICRNDILSGSIAFNSTDERIKAVYQTEKAIQDFSSHYKRKLTYANWETPIYSMHIKNKEA